jgi:hypothetical protein
LLAALLPRDIPQRQGNVGVYAPSIGVEMGQRLDRHMARKTSARQLLILPSRFNFDREFIVG